MIQFDFYIDIKILKEFYAKLTLYEKCKINKIFSCNAVAGINGGGKNGEGDKKTPIGKWKIGEAYGICENPGTCVQYTKVTNDMYWCSTSSKANKYNTLIYKSQNPCEDYSQDEHLIDYPISYKYFLDIGFNKEKIPFVGSAIFLHCWKGPNIPTSGCIAISEENMLKILKIINQNTIISIY